MQYKITTLNIQDERRYHQLLDNINSYSNEEHKEVSRGQISHETKFQPCFGTPPTTSKQRRDKKKARILK